jgi:hypothetical protein
MLLLPDVIFDWTTSFLSDASIVRGKHWFCQQENLRAPPPTVWAENVGITTGCAAKKRKAPTPAGRFFQSPEGNFHQNYNRTSNNPSPSHAITIPDPNMLKNIQFQNQTLPNPVGICPGLYDFLDSV